MRATLEEHRARVPACLRKVYNVREMTEDSPDLPAKQPECIFDITDRGVRLLMSREIGLSQGDEVLLHVSISPLVDFKDMASASPGVEFSTISRVLKFLESVIQELMPNTLLVPDGGVLMSSGKNVPHWFYQDIGENP